MKHYKISSVFFRLLTVSLIPGFLIYFPFAVMASETKTEVVDRIVAVVNDEIIVLQEVNTLVQTFQEQIETAGYSEEEKRSILVDIRERFINQLVNRKLIIQAAKELDWLTVSESEIDASVQHYKDQYDLTDEQLRESLEEEGMTMEDFRTELKESSLSSSIENYEVSSKIVITKEDVTQHYSQNHEKYLGQTTYHLRNIFIKAPASNSSADQEKVKNKLDQIFMELNSGESFENTARKYSEWASADEGGELGNFKLSDLTPNLRAAVEPLAPGEYTQALENSDGYQILFVQDIHKESNVPLESVYSEIENELYKEQYQEMRQAWIDSLREDAHIKIIE